MLGNASAVLEYPYPFGIGVYALGLFLTSAWWVLMWGEATTASYSPIVDYLFEGTPCLDMTTLITAQLIGGLMFYQFYTKPLWRLGFGDIHVEKISDDSYCISDIQVNDAF